MSFKVAISDVLIANEALAMLPEEPIVSLSEQSVSARECKRAYKPVVAEMLEAHHWGLAAKRVALAQLLNDRLGEWAYAYAKPADMAFPVRMLQRDEQGRGAQFSGWAYRDNGFWWGGIKAMEQVGGTIYSGINAGTLEYTSFDITEADFTALFKRIVTLELAARICQPISKNATRTRELMAQAEGERQRAIANDLNRSQPFYGDGLTESAIVRHGGLSWGFTGNYALDPVANPALAPPANAGA